MAEPIPPERVRANRGTDETQHTETMSGESIRPSSLAYPFLLPAIVPGDLGSLGEYRVLQLLGEGGMGFVFRAEDPTLQRPVALKVMRPEIAARPNASERFLREGRAAAALKSDHVITIYQVGQANGVPFLAMEYLEGLTLDDWLRRQQGPVDTSMLVKVATDVLRGLSAAHAKGLTHRDIKPGNLWLDTATARVKVLDFGLTRGSGADQNLTQEGTVVGTPAYMAPEQASGQTVDGRADLFAVGVVLYRMLTGRSPFQRDNVMATLTALAIETPPSSAKIAPHLPKELTQLIDRMMAKDPSQRPPSAASAMAELSALELRLRGEPGQMPVVVYAPAAQAEPNLFADIDEPTEHEVTKSRSQVAAAPIPRKISAMLVGSIIASMLTVVIAGVIVVKILSRGKAVEEETPEVTKLETTKNPKTTSTTGATTKKLTEKSGTLPIGVKVVPPDLIAPMTPVKPESIFSIDYLDPAKHIPPGEKFDWQPKELVAVLGSHRQRGVFYSSPLSMSRDGKWIVSSRTLINTETMQITRLPFGFVISPDGKRTAEGGMSEYDLADMTKPPVKYTLPGDIMAYITDNIVLARSGEALTIFRIDEKQPKALKVFPCTPQSTAVSSPDGKYVAIGLKPGEPIEIYDITAQGTLERQRSLPGNEGKFKPGATGGTEVLSFSANGHLATMGEQIHLWDITPDQPKLLCSSSEKTLFLGVCLSPKGDALFNWGQSGCVYFSIKSNVMKRVISSDTLRMDNDLLHHFMMTPDAKKVITKQLNHTVRIWNITDGLLVEQNPIKPMPQMTIDSSISPDGRFVTLYHEDRRAHLWNLGNLTSNPLNHDTSHPVASFSPDGKSYAYSNGELAPTLTIKSLPPGDNSTKPVVGTGWPASFTPDGRSIYGWKLTNDILDLRLSDLTTTAPTTRFEHRFPQGCNLLQVVPDGRFVMTGALSGNNQLELKSWSVSERGFVERQSLSKPGVHFTLSPNGKMAVISMVGEGYHIYDVQDGILTFRRTDPGRGIWADFAPDSRTMSILGQDNHVVIRDCGTGKDIHSISMPHIGAMTVKYHPDGRHLFVNTWANILYILRLPKPPSLPIGKFGLRFGPDDTAIATQVPIRPSTVLTVEAWITFQTVQENGGRELIHTPTGTIAISDNRLRYYSFHGHVDANQTILTGRRVHVAGVNDGKKRYLYIDGQLTGTSTDAGIPIPENEQQALGEKLKTITVGGTSLFEGIIDAVRVSTTARYEKDFTPPATFTKDKDTFALYLFDEGQGDTLKDSSGNGYHAKINGAKWVKGDNSSTSVSPVPAK